MKKCDYCGKEITYFEQYCSDDCEKRTVKYYDFSRKFGKLFAVVNFVCVFGIPIGLFLLSIAKFLGTALAASSCLLLGIMLILLPFPTDSMISKFKLKKAIKVTRIIGLCVIVLGLLILGFSLIFVL